MPLAGGHKPPPRRNQPGHALQGTSGGTRRGGVIPARDPSEHKRAHSCLGRESRKTGAASPGTRERRPAHPEPTNVVPGPFLPTPTQRTDCETTRAPPPRPGTPFPTSPPSPPSQSPPTTSINFGSGCFQNAMSRVTHPSLFALGSIVWWAKLDSEKKLP